MAKDKRRYCDNPRCGRQYRHSRDDSKTCSDACRSALSRVNRAEAKALAKRELVVAWRRVQRDQAAQPTAAAPPPSVDRPSGAVAAQSSRTSGPKCGCIGRDFGHMKTCALNPAPKSVVVVISNVPTRFPGTALGRGFR